MIFLKRKATAARNRALAALVASAAFGCAAVAFLGWIIGAPVLTHFGIGILIWPWTAIGFAALAVAHLALIARRRRFAMAFFAVPLLIGLVSVFDALTGDDWGFHRLLFPEQISRAVSANPGLPASMVLVQWALLAAGMLLASRQTWRACVIACILANVPLALSIMTLGLTAASSRIASGPGNFLWASLPATLASLLLCLSIFFFCRAAARPGTAAGEDLAGWTFVRVFPFLLLVPGITWILEQAAVGRGADPRWVGPAGAGLNMLLVIAVLAWAMRRMSRQQALVRAILATVPDAMVAFTKQGIIRRFSPGAVKMLGYQPEDVLGKHFSEIVAEPGHTGLAAASGGPVEAGPQVRDRVTRTLAVRKDGVEVPVEQRSVEILTDGGEALVIWFLRDLTETVHNEHRLGSMAAELSHVARLSAMGEMAAGIAHELNQPLTAVVNYTQAAGLLLDSKREGPLDLAAVRGLIDKASKQSLRAGEIIRRMRDFASKGQVEAEVVSVSETIRDAVALVFVGPVPMDIRLVYDIDPRATTMIADPVQIQQVLVNLLRNSTQAMQRASIAGKEIVIFSRLRPDQMIEIGVQDTGPGIPEAVRANLFAPFAASEGGMGVGLSICRRIVEAHGGQISCEDRREGGVIFRFTVPTPEQREDGQG